jgi:pimeloyl-ACP methyl ester carboxylesterase
MSDSERRGFVLVHGGEHGPWCWNDLVPLLKWPAVTVALPGRDARAGDPIQFTLEDSGRLVAAAVERSAFDPCIVVCHSLGGLAVLAAELQYAEPPTHRVFISAVTPKPGANALDALPRLFRAYLRVRLGHGARRRTVLHLLPRWLAVAVWFHDLDRSRRAAAAGKLCAESPLIPLERTPDKPTPPGAATYLMLTRDRAIRPRVQRQMARTAASGTSGILTPRTR